MPELQDFPPASEAVAHKVEGPDQTLNERGVDLSYYEDRLANPELLDGVVVLRDGESGFVAVPVGGARKIGQAPISFPLARAQRFVATLAAKPGFPNVHLMQHHADSCGIRWGSPDIPDDLLSYSNAEIGLLFGYKPDAVAAFVAPWNQADQERAKQQLDLYALLGVSRSANALEIKAAYEKMQTMAHNLPDNHTAWAWMILSNPLRRAVYDAQMSDWCHPEAGDTFEESWMQLGNDKWMTIFGGDVRAGLRPEQIQMDLSEKSLEMALNRLNFLIRNGLEAVLRSGSDGMLDKLRMIVSVQREVLGRASKYPELENMCQARRYDYFLQQADTFMSTF